MDRAVLDAYGWTDIQPTCEFLLDYEDDEDESSRRRKPWRYRWPDDVRDEVLRPPSRAQPPARHGAKSVNRAILGSSPKLKYRHLYPSSLKHRVQLAAFSDISPGRLVPTYQGAMAFVPDPTPRNLPLDGATVRLLARAEHRLGALGGAASRLVNPYLVGAQLLRREAILSSRIEETIATPEQIALFELDAEPRTPDAREVGNFVRASERALASVQAGEPIATRLLLETHRILLTGVRGERERPGEFRTAQNFIGGSRGINAARFVPPSHLELPALLSDLERFINEDVPELPLLVRIAVAHYQFETIHPFRDGNGRIGRLIIMLMLVRDRLLPGPLLTISSAFEHRRDEYNDRLLAVSTAGDWSGWLRFFLESVAESADEALHLVESLDALRAAWYARLQSARSSALLLKLVDALFARPATSIGEATKLLGVTPASASANIARLVDAGILREITGRTRDRIYLAQPILDLMNDRSADVASREPAT